MFDIAFQTQRIFELNEKWWTDLNTGLPIDRNEGELFTLMNSELSEAMEGERKSLMDDKLPQYPMAGVEMVDFSIRVLDYTGRREVFLWDYFDAAKGRFPWVNARPESNRAELIWGMQLRLGSAYDSPKSHQREVFSWLLADARHYCRLFGYPFEEMFEAKYQFNVSREDHKHESRKLAHGKKF